MGVILWLFLFIAILTIFYSIRKYNHSSMYQYKRAKSQQNFYMVEKHTENTPFIEITYKGVGFKGIMEVGIDETTIKVSQVTIHLTEPFDVLKGWKRDDFYIIEKEIYTKYPYAEIIWDEPINHFLDHIDIPVIE